MSAAGLCALAGMTRQNLYRERKARTRASVEEALVLELVRAERRVQPMVGTRKLMVLIAPELAEAGVGIGRDRLFGLLAREKLLVRRRRGTPRTTDSRHRWRVHRNMLKGTVLAAPHEAWVCDITYLRTREGFAYLALVMDAWSRKIVGWHVGATLEALGAMAALEMALAQLPAGATPLHHSDRGTQYCCGDYVALLEARQLAVSMTEENHCYENARAERLNGILKQEYGLGSELASHREAIAAVAEAVRLYNGRRPHAALGYRTPDQTHAHKREAAA